MASVVVIGGGVIGLCVALALQDRGCKVTVADRSTGKAPPSLGNAGRIAIELSEPLASLATLRSLPRKLFIRGGPVALPPAAMATWLPFAFRLIAASTPSRFKRGTEALSSLLAGALPAWRRRLWLAGAPELLVETGHYSIWEDSRLCVKGRQTWFRNSGAASVTEPNFNELGTLRKLIPAPIAGALKFSGTASIADPTELLAALKGAFINAGGRLENMLLSVESASGMADAVVVAAGVDSAHLLVQIGHTVPMIAERGYHIEQPNMAWPNDMPPLYFEDRSVVVTRFRSALRATSFAEFTKKDAPPDPRKWARLRLHARELGLPFGSEATQWLGSRPTLPDYLPAIGRSRNQSNVFYAFGHQHLGLTLAAITGEIIGALVSEEPTPLSLTLFNIDRFL